MYTTSFTKCTQRTSHTTEIMNRILFVVVAVVVISFSHLIFVQGQIECGSNICAEGEGCCYEAPYNRLTCYDNTTYQCINYTLCDIHDNQCGGICFDPSGYTCYIGPNTTSWLCPSHDQHCGDACFNPLNYECNNNNLGPRELSSTPPACGRGHCDSVYEECCDESNTQLNVSNSEPQCYNFVNQSCCSTIDLVGNTVSKTCGFTTDGAAERCCLISGYDAANYEYTYSIQCYDPTHYFCCVGGPLCTFGERCCVHGTVY